MIINFKNIKTKDINDKETIADISKDLGNMIFYGERDIAISDMGHDIYHHGEFDLNKEQAEVVLKYVQEQFMPIVKRPLVPILESIINGNE